MQSISTPFSTKNSKGLARLKNYSDHFQRKSYFKNEFNNFHVHNRHLKFCFGRAKQVLPSGGRTGTNERGEVLGKGGKRVSMVQ